jgi:hypothetical protein
LANQIVLWIAFPPQELQKLTPESMSAICEGAEMKLFRIVLKLSSTGTAAQESA